LFTLSNDYEDGLTFIDMFALVNLDIYLTHHSDRPACLTLN